MLLAHFSPLFSKTWNFLRRRRAARKLSPRTDVLCCVIVMAMVCGLSLTGAWAQAVAPNLNPTSSLFLDAPAYGSGDPHAFGVVLGDLNGDGKADVVVANACPGCASASVGVLLGNGDSTFQPAVAYGSGGAGAVSVTVGDVNGDGKLDVVVVNQCVSLSNCNNGTVSVLLGNGDGTLKAAAPFSLPGAGGYALSLVDLNGDGKLDLLLNVCPGNNCNPGTVAVMLGNGDGTFHTPVFYSSGGLFPMEIAVADINGDGKPDVVVTNLCMDASCMTGGTFAVLLGNGDGTFQLPKSNATSQEIFGVAVGDVDGDNKPDVVITAANSPQPNVAVYKGNGDGTFQFPPVGVTTGAQEDRQASLVDVNGDGKLDLVVSHLDFGTSVSLGNGDGTFQAPKVYIPAGRFFAVGDVNGDGKPDVLLAEECFSLTVCSSGLVSVLLGNGDGTFAGAQYYGINGKAVAAGDLNGDGKPDLIVAQGGQTGQLIVLQGNGDGTLRPGVSYPTAAYAETVADLNGDGKLDVAVLQNCGAQCPNGVVGVLLGNGDGTLQGPVNYNSTGTTQSAILAGDVNGDGKPDLLVANWCADSTCASGSVAVLLNNGDGSFKAPVSYTTGAPGTGSIVVRDVNGDGKPD
jgi:hypothetical protein